MTWQQILVQTGIITGVLSLLGILIKGRIIKKIEEFKKVLEWETRKREQVAQIAELVSLWIKKKYFPTCDDNQVRYDAQKKYWELALWLPAPVLKKLNEAFTKTNAGDYKEAMILARKIIVGEEDDVKAEELVHWPSIDAS